MFTLTISTDNAAFDDDAVFDEISRILIEVAAKMRSHVKWGTLRDVNGNAVGMFELEQRKS